MGLILFVFWESTINIPGISESPVKDSNAELTLKESLNAVEQDRVGEVCCKYNYRTDKQNRYDERC